MRILLGLAPISAQAADVVAAGAMPDAMLPPPTPLTASQSLYLEVTLNQAPRGLLPFIDQRGRLQALPQVLRQLGFPARGEVPVYLDQLVGVQVRYDARMQTLAIDAPLDQLDLPTATIGARANDLPHASASPGVLLNYDLYATHVQNQSSLALTSELRVFGVGRGTLSNLSLQRRFQDGDGRRWRSESVRLDTRWTLDFPEQAVSLDVGDFYSGFLDWSRPVRMGGIQIGRNYGLQPYRVLSPTPSFLGQAVVPSNVELYVDGLRQYSGEVPVGPFQLATQPGISGMGTAQVVITDAFGRSRTVDFDFYGTQQLLARGLTDWSVGVGQLREDYGVRSFAYDDRTLASATWRHGVTDRFTAEAHAEAGGGLRQAGIGGGWLAGRAGVLTAAYARSQYGDLRGGQYSVGYNWNNRRFNVNLLSRRSHGDYRDLGALQDSLPPDITEQATFGVSLERFGAVSASYLRLRQPDGQDDRYASLFWSRTFAQRWSAYVSANQNLGDSSDRSLYVSLAATLGNNRQASVGAQRNGSEPLYSVDVSQPVPGDGGGNGMGWRVQARQGDRGTGGLAEAGWLTPTGRYSVGAVHEGDSTYGYANAGGALVWMGGHVFAAREVNDAFAVVSTGGIAGVPVRLENREIGVTDRNGLLLVSPLLSWQRNRLSIDTMGLPADIAAERVDDWVTPRQGAGLGVSFGLRRSRAVQFVAQDSAGAALPVGSVVRFGQQGEALVGYDGAVYLQDLPADGRLQVTTPEGPCQLRVSLPVVTATGAIPRLGPVTCVPLAAPGSP
ncbi:fimbriae usher protein [Stenotrophomonas maltophilia]|nr:fimbriae usher protein [Stenotrophomonas maltophilia]